MVMRECASKRENQHGEAINRINRTVRPKRFNRQKSMERMVPMAVQNKMLHRLNTVESRCW